MHRRNIDVVPVWPSWCRSILFLPVLPPTHPLAVAWGAFMLAVDLVYTAFWVPLGIAFCTASYGQPGSGCTSADLVGGARRLCGAPCLL